MKRPRALRVPALASAFAALLALTACGAPQGPHVRLATAGPADLAAVKGKDNVWFDLEPGDTVPVNFALVGDIEGGSRPGQGLLRARKKVSIVMLKNQPMQFSFDGKTFASANSAKFVIAALPRADGKGVELGWLVYVGQSGNMDEALEVLVREHGDGGKGETSAAK
jgi:hypothetical protein